MTREGLRHACYLAALSRLHHGLVHDARSQMGSVALQLELIGELLQRAEPPLNGLAARITPAIERGRTGLERLQRQVESAYGAFAPESPEPSDLADRLGELSGLMAGAARERGVEWKVTTSGGGARVRHPARTRETLGIAAIELLFALPPGGRLEARLETAGRRASVTFTGAPLPPPGESWIEAVHEAMSEVGGEARADRERLVLLFPLLEAGE